MWRMNKSPKSVASEPAEEVLNRNHGTYVPTVAGICEREQLACSHRCCLEHCLSVGVAANHSVECYDVSISQRARGHSKVTKEKVCWAWLVARLELPSGGLQIGR